MGVVVITGANRGIGLSLARRLAGRGETVLAAVRKRSAELDGLGVEVVERVDVTEKSAGERIISSLSGRKIGVLIHNAGILAHTSFAQLNPDAIRRQFEVNALAPLCLTVALGEHFDRPAKVGLITSRMGSIADNTSGGSYGYRMSKAALNAAGKSLAHDLAGRGVAVGLLHPGWVQTDMTGHSGNIQPDESARLLIERIDGLNADNSGTFWHCNGEELPW